MSKQTKITAFFSSSSITVDTRDNAGHSQTNDESRREVVNLKRKLSLSDNPVIIQSKQRAEPKSKRVFTGQKVCPFYKKIPNTCFAVDAFQYGSIGGISAYFLTHFHSDHYIGLKNSFKHKIYCSPITAALVRHKFPNGLFTLKVIQNESTEDVMGVRVTFFDANHCPGAVIILFELNSGIRYLHTGDFRADHSFFTYKQLICRPIDSIFLDTTYCDPKYDFSPQKVILDKIVSISCDYHKKNPKLLIVCGTYSVGKENVFISIAKALNLKIWTNNDKRLMYKCYKDSRIDSSLVSDKFKSNLHVLSMNNINETVISLKSVKMKRITIFVKFLQKYLKEFNGVFDEVLAFRPTGWEHNKNSTNGVKMRKHDNITICGQFFN